MSNLIERQKAIETLKEYEVVESDNFTRTDPVSMMTVATIANCIEAIVELPSADFERKKGKWKPFDLTWGRSVYSCTACGEAIDIPTEISKPIYSFCPNCGAEMRGEDE